MKTQTISAKSVTLGEVVKPLVDFLNCKYPSKDGALRACGTYQRAFCKDASETNSFFHEASIGLYFEPTVDAHVIAAVLTLLEKGSSRVDSGPDDYTRPLSFSLATLTELCPGGWMTAPELRITLGYDIEPAAAGRQIELLTQCLGDKRNLVEVSAEKRAFFGICAK